MVMKKPTISMDPEVYAEAKAAADEAGLSFSAWMELAAQRQIRRDALAAAVADYEAEFGAFTVEEKRESRIRLGLPALPEEEPQERRSA